MTMSTDRDSAISVRQLTNTRIPTVDGEFSLALYENSLDDKDHLALTYGEVEGKENVLVRVHSECFTGDVIGSLRCDCGEQLNASMRLIAEQGAGIILYLRQEGRGIGLLSKLKAYDLQDKGFDTVEANHMLGHEADERDYTIGALMLRDLGVRSVQLLTNNPEKIESLDRLGIDVTGRVPIQPHINPYNAAYLQTKVERMRHLLSVGPTHEDAASAEPRGNHHGSDVRALVERASDHFQQTGRPFVTLSYAQSLDGSIAAVQGAPLSISGGASLGMTHRLRAAHDAILVGIGTVLADDPRLTVRLADGSHPIPVVLDTKLRFPLDAQLLSGTGPGPIIATNQNSSRDTERKLAERGARVLRLPCSDAGGLCLNSLLDALGRQQVRSLMVEGGSHVITSFLAHRLVNYMVVTVAPLFVGGVPALNALSAQAADGEAGRLDGYQPSDFPRLRNISYRWLGQDLMLEGEPYWDA